MSVFARTIAAFLLTAAAAASAASGAGTGAASGRTDSRHTAVTALADGMTTPCAACWQGSPGNGG